LNYGAISAKDADPRTHIKIVNFATRQYEEPTNMARAGSYLIRKMKLVMSSGILAANPGSQTGELLVGYPFSAVSTSQSTESMLLKLRVYLGSVLYRPENILILPHIAFEGVTSGCETDANSDDYVQFVPIGFLKAELDKPTANMYNVCKKLTKAIKEDTNYANNPLGTALGHFQRELVAGVVSVARGKIGVEGAQGFYWNDTDECVQFDDEIEYPAVICRGSSVNKTDQNTGGYVHRTSNTGHLGCIDSPQCADRIWGTAGGQVYKADPNRV
jgi:hypothetical protein